ncbi:unnamed protein product [Schistosoma intercalatum]|nr:unnamed protein product [Schistosoma intercalatum]CAH8593118.1 unnamed protein product [Schistosoma intercalatum]
MLIGIVSLISILLVEEATGKGVIFDVELLILDTWANLYTRLADTWKCFLETLRPSLGGKNHTCVESDKKNK